MSADLRALLAHARWLPARERARLGADWAARQPVGTLLVTTCHRVEMYGTHGALAELEPQLSDGVHALEGRDAARHLIELAIGRDSAVVAEDQVLHQLRQAAAAARARGELPRGLDRLIDVALRAGRRARSWLPASRMSIADLALAQAIGRGDVHGAHFLIVGSGEMGRRAMGHLAARGGLLTVASRTFENARELAGQYHSQHARFDPGPDVIGSVAGIVVALAGPWRIAQDTRRALVDSTSWVIDLSSPGALEQDLPAVLASRLISIDDLSEAAAQPLSDRLLERLDGLAEQALVQHEQWAEDEARRAAADALTARARALQAAELDRLWRRLPALDQGERDEVERTVEQITRLLLRDPLEQLGDDADGRHVRAARDLFRL